ncbi:MAG: HEPN domain-containing protein [Thermodesulfobacteriota bacterium]|nr:HEPN domain-containing protein [Thermodesulfobacteriota bacterium]
MVKKDKIKYWLKTADQDWRVANHLFEKKDYSYALFFGHLTIEKILKAIFIDKKTKRHHFRIILYIFLKKPN